MVTEMNFFNLRGGILQEGKIVTRVLASTASDGLTFNADKLQQQQYIDKHFYPWNVIYCFTTVS